MEIFKPLLYLFFLTGFVAVPSPVHGLTGVTTPLISGVLSKECNTSKDNPALTRTYVDDRAVDIFFAAPVGLQRLSPTCMLEISSPGPLEISMRHEKTEYRPHIYLWSEERRTWESQETIMNRSSWIAKSTLQGSSRYVVSVFADPIDLYQGKASWYKDSRYPTGAATHLYPLGTKLRVTNTANGKSTDAVVTSTWANSHPGRIIDLTSLVFRKIGDLKQGILPITIERILSS